MSLTDVLRPIDHVDIDGDRVMRVRESGDLADALADADLPLVDRERGIAVIRLDPELDDADYLAWLAMELHDDGFDPWVVQKVQRIAERCRAARIIGGEQGDGE